MYQNRSGFDYYFHFMLSWFLLFTSVYIFVCIFYSDTLCYHDNGLVPSQSPTTYEPTTRSPTSRDDVSGFDVSCHWLRLLINAFDS